MENLFRARIRGKCENIEESALIVVGREEFLTRVLEGRRLIKRGFVRIYKR